MGAAATVFAVEGPSDSGKSTLARHLAAVPDWQPSMMLPCYVDIVDPSALPPSVASTPAEQLESLAFFVELDRRRHREADDSDPPPKLVVADRSWLSLLAHTYAVEQSGGPSAYSAARQQLIDDASLLHPDLVVVLRASDAAREARMALADSGAWFTSPAFNVHFDAFFDHEAQELVPRLVMIDANRSAAEVASATVAAIIGSGSAP